LTESNSNKILLLQPRLELPKKKFSKKLAPGVQKKEILPASQQLELKSICCNTKTILRNNWSSSSSRRRRKHGIKNRVRKAWRQTDFR
jgi:hypothetical protein